MPDVRKRLQEENPDWNIRPTVSGQMWIATRHRYTLIDADLTAGLFPTLIEDSLEDLDQQLRTQRRIEHEVYGGDHKPVDDAS